MLAPDDPRHGSVNAYNNLGCRCDECKEAWRVRTNKWRHAVASRLERHREYERRRRLRMKGAGR